MSVASTTLRQPGRLGARAPSCSPAGSAIEPVDVDRPGARPQLVAQRVGHARSRRPRAGTPGRRRRRPPAGPTARRRPRRARAGRGRRGAHRTSTGWAASRWSPPAPGRVQPRRPAGRRRGRRRAWPTWRGCAGRAAGAGGRRGPGPGPRRPAGCARGTRRRSPGRRRRGWSFCRRRVRMPSVTTSTRCRGRQPGHLRCGSRS